MSWAGLVAAGLIGGSAVFLFERLFRVAIERPSPSVPGPDRPSTEVAALAKEIEDLRESLRLAEGRRATEPVREASRVAEPGQDLAAFDERLTRLEQRVSEAIANGPDPKTGTLPDTLDELTRVFEASRSPDPDKDRAYRILLLRRILEEFPTDGDAFLRLHDLIDEYIGAGDFDQAVAALDAFARSLQLKNWQRESASQGIYSAQRDYVGWRRVTQAILDHPDAPEYERVEARFWHAYAFEQEGNDPVAHREFANLLRDYEGNESPVLKNTLDGAREQLKKIDERSK